MVDDLLAFKPDDHYCEVSCLSSFKIRETNVLQCMQYTCKLRNMLFAVPGEWIDVRTMLSEVLMHCRAYHAYMIVLNKHTETNAEMESRVFDNHRCGLECLFRFKAVKQASGGFIYICNLSACREYATPIHHSPNFIDGESVELIDDIRRVLVHCKEHHT